MSDIPSPVIRGILFDKDGTLLKYDESWGPVNRELAKIASAGDAALADHLLRACGMDPETGAIIPDSLLAAGNTVEIAHGLIAAGSPLPADVLTARLDALFTAATDFAVPVTDLAPLFQRLKTLGYKLGIASSDNEDSIRKMARRFGIDTLVDFIAGYDSGFGGKPEPGMVLAFCAAVDLEAYEVAMVGDNNHDLHMGRNAGTGLRIGVLSGTGSRDSLSAAAHYCLDDITQLESVLPNRSHS